MAEGEERRRRILGAREDRLARIMSLGTGRTVDPSEVKLGALHEAPPAQPPLSPTDSERAAAGIGSALDRRSSSDSEEGESVGDGKEEGLSLLDPDPEVAPPCPRRVARQHLIVVVLTAVAVIIWLRLAVMSSYASDAQTRRTGFSAMRARMSAAQSTSEPWHVVAGSFVAVEAAEWILGRISLLSVPRDAALYALLLLLAVRMRLIAL